MVTKTDKTVAIAVVVVLIGVAFILGYYSGAGTPEVPITGTTGTEQVHLMIDYGNGTMASYHFDPQENMTAYTLLEEASEEGGFPMEKQDYDFGILITGINEVRGGDQPNYYWLYWVDGTSPDRAANLYPVESGDVVLYKYGYVEWS